jgi:glycosyltransferase involved in cell wall biosynthesis
MIGYSGVGVYIKNVVFMLNTSINCLGWDVKDVKIYSVFEQYIYLKIPSSKLFWSPHWNIPLLPIRAKKRMVTIHDVYHLAFANQFSALKRWYAKLMIHQAVSRSDIILTVSEFSKQEIIKYTGTKKTIHVVHNGIGVDPSIYDDSLGSLVDAPYILYVGNVKPHKNLSRALAAFEALPAQYADVKFVIVGKKENFITGDDAFIQRALLNPNVIFTGYVDDARLVGYYKHAILLFFPSLYEGFGLPPLEAQACGCPCLVSNAASLPEVCGDSVIYCDPYDVNDMSVQLERLLSNKALQDDLITKGFENIKRFSWEKSAQQIMKIIEENA